MDDRSWHIRHDLDVEAMRQAAKALEGEHDFSAFRASGCVAAHPIRRVQAIRVERQGDCVVIIACGHGFLRYMVRIIAGTLVEVGLGRRPVSWVADVLQGCDRSQAGRTAPARGLSLVPIEMGRGLQSVICAGCWAQVRKLRTVDLFVVVHVEVAEGSMSSMSSSTSSTFSTSAKSLDSLSDFSSFTTGAVERDELPLDKIGSVANGRVTGPHCILDTAVRAGSNHNIWCHIRGRCSAGPAWFCLTFGFDLPCTDVTTPLNIRYSRQVKQQIMAA